MENPPVRRVFELMAGLGATQSLYVAAALGLPELIDAGHTTSEALARATSSDRRSLFQVLRLLADYGVLAGDDETGYSVTPDGATLRADEPGSLRDLVMIFGDEFYRAWGRLLDNVRTGRPAFEVAYGSSMYDHFTGDAEAGARFDRAMANGYFFDELAGAVDLSGTGTVVDVAGGTGGLLRAVLAANPDVRGVLFDQPRVIASARELPVDDEVAGRLSFVGGSYDEGVPEGGDAYLLSRIVHRHDDESATALLKSCLAAMGPQGRLVIVERPVVPASRHSLGVWSDVHMMVLIGGIERTEQEYLDLLDRSGFVLEATHGLPLDFVALVARPAR